MVVCYVWPHRHLLAPHREKGRRACEKLRHSKVLGNISLVRRIASFIPDKERGEEEEEEDI